MAPLNAPSLSASVNGDMTPSILYDQSSSDEASNALYPLHLRPVSPSLLVGHSMETLTTGDTFDSSYTPNGVRGPHHPPPVPLSENPLLASMQLFRRLNGTFRLRRLLHHPVVRFDIVFMNDSLFQPSKGRSTIGYSPYQLVPQAVSGAREILEQNTVVECRPKDHARYANLEVRERKAFVLQENSSWEVHIPVERSVHQGIDAADLNGSMEHWHKQVTLVLDQYSLQGYLKGESRQVVFNSVNDSGGLSASEGGRDCMRITWTVTDKPTELFEIRHWLVGLVGEEESGCVDELWRVS